MDMLISHTIFLVLGAAIGAAGYRYLLKRDPAKLEEWAAKIKAAGKE